MMIGFLRGLWCALFHKEHHHFLRIGYGGYYLRVCDHCRSTAEIFR